MVVYIWSKYHKRPIPSLPHPLALVKLVRLGLLIFAKCCLELFHIKMLDVRYLMVLFMLINLTYGTTIFLWRCGSVQSGQQFREYCFWFWVLNSILFEAKIKLCNDLYLAMPGNSSACGSDLCKGPLLFFKYILQGK